MSTGRPSTRISTPQTWLHLSVVGRIVFSPSSILGFLSLTSWVSSPVSLLHLVGVFFLHTRPRSPTDWRSSVSLGLLRKVSPDPVRRVLLFSFSYSYLFPRRLVKVMSSVLSSTFLHRSLTYFWLYDVSHLMRECSESTLSSSFCCTINFFLHLSSP